MGTFVEFSKSFWSSVFALAGFTFSMKDISAQAGKTSGVVPFRAFRNSENYNQIVVLVEPTHTDGAYVHVFTNDEFNVWKNNHMHIDIKNRDM